MKRCSKCGEWKKESEFGVSRYGTPLARCKACDKIYNIEYRIKNRDKLLAYQREYSKTHPEKHGMWAKNNPDKAKEKLRKWYSAHPGYCTVRSREYRLNHPEKNRKYNSDWARRHPDRMRASRDAHPEWQAKRHAIREWGLDNPPQELIDLKAEQIRLFRAVRDKRMGVQEHED